MPTQTNETDAVTNSPAAPEVANGSDASATPAVSPSAEPGARRGASGKALIAWLATGSLGVAAGVFVVAWMMGC